MRETPASPGAISFQKQRPDLVEGGSQLHVSPCRERGLWLQLKLPPTWCPGQKRSCARGPVLPSAGPLAPVLRQQEAAKPIWKAGTPSYLLRGLLSCPSSAVAAVGDAMFHVTVILPIKPRMPVKCTASSQPRSSSATAAPALSTPAPEA